MQTPDTILDEIRHNRALLMQSVGLLEQTQLAAAHAALELQAAEAHEMAQSEGSIPDRKNAALLATLELRRAADVAEAAHQRVKAQIKATEHALVSLQSELRHARESGA